MQDMQETWVWSLGQEDPLEKEMATYSSILPGKSHGQRSLAGYSPWGLQDLDMTKHKRWKYQTIWSASWEICMKARKQQLELDMEQQTGSK